MRRVAVLVVLALSSLLWAQEAPLGKSLRTQADEALLAGKRADSIPIYERWLAADPTDGDGWYISQGDCKDDPAETITDINGNPVSAASINPAAVEKIVELQRELLRRAADQVAPGGALVYSTCALLPDENQDLVRRLIDEELRFRIEKEIETLPRGGYSDGGYAALLRHVGES